jgi:hypothetical protein
MLAVGLAVSAFVPGNTPNPPLTWIENVDRKTGGWDQGARPRGLGARKFVIGTGKSVLFKLSGSDNLHFRYIVTGAAPIGNPAAPLKSLFHLMPSVPKLDLDLFPKDFQAEATAVNAALDGADELHQFQEQYELLAEGSASEPVDLSKLQTQVEAALKNFQSRVDTLSASLTALKNRLSPKDTDSLPNLRLAYELEPVAIYMKSAKENFQDASEEITNRLRILPSTDNTTFIAHTTNAPTLIFVDIVDRATGNVVGELPTYSLDLESPAHSSSPFTLGLFASSLHSDSYSIIPDVAPSVKRSSAAVPSITYRKNVSALIRPEVDYGLGWSPSVAPWSLADRLHPLFAIGMNSSLSLRYIAGASYSLSPHFDLSLGLVGGSVTRVRSAVASSVDHLFDIVPTLGLTYRIN